MSCKHEWGKEELGKDRLGKSVFAVDITCLKCGSYKCDICGNAVKTPTYGMCRKCYGGLYGKDSEDME